MPEGNLSFSRLIMFRFIGIARLVPSTARKKTHSAITGHGSPSPPGRSGVTESSSSAGIADTSVPPVAKPAADAVDCMQLFSRIVIGVFARPTLVTRPHAAYDTMHAVSA